MPRFKLFVMLAKRWPRSLRLQATLSHRLGGGFGLLLLMMVATIGLALFQMNLMQQQMRSIVESNVARIGASQAMMDSVNGVSVATLGFALSNDSEDIKDQSKEVDERIAAYEVAQAHFESLGAATALDPEMRERLKASVRDTKNLTVSVAQAAAGGGSAAGALMSLNPLSVQLQWTKDIQKLVAAEQALCNTTYEAARDSFVKTRMLLMSVTLAALLIGAFTAWNILRSVTRPINLAIDHARRISQGDLSGEIDTRGGDEMAGLLRMLAEMQSQLRRMIGRVRDASVQIRSAAADISAGGRDLSARTEETASNLQQTAASMEQLALLVTHGAEAGQQAKHWIGNATTVAAKGGEVMGRVVTTMEEIDKSSRRIGQIVGVIDSIAFQTNILALNAAVEAARAGEQGRGFAVVASEVRGLAGRSAEAAREIRTLIATSVERVGSGTDLVRSAGETMNEIVSAVGRAYNTIDDMASKLEAQREGMGEVSAAVSQVDHMTQQNAALAEESAASTIILEEQSTLLYDAVEEFRA